MISKKNRPVDSGILHSRLPPGAFVSILHRITGVALILVFPFVFYLIDRSLQNPAAFGEVAALVQQPAMKVALAVAAWLFAQHFFSGIRHLLLDLDIGIDRRSARMSAALVLLLAGLSTLFAILVLVT